MNSKLCTSIEQSEKLLGLGIDPSTADMYYKYVLPKSDKLHHVPNVGEPTNALYWYNEGYTFSGENEPLELKDFCIPCWSLAALLELIPKSIRNYNNRTWRNYGLNLFRSHYYCCGYSFGPSLSEANHDSLCCIGSEESWLDAVYKTVIWCIEKGHIKVNK